jgi:hypothetical protein
MLNYDSKAKHVAIQASAPAVPATGDLWWETGTSLMWFWNGTYWLSENRYTMTQTIENVARPGTTLNRFCPRADASVAYNFYICGLCATMYVASPNNTSDYWVLSFINQVGTPLASVNTSGNAPDTFVIETSSVNSLVTLATIPTVEFRFGMTYAGSPGNLYSGATLTYRWAHL